MYIRRQRPTLLFFSVNGYNYTLIISQEDWTKFFKSFGASLVTELKVIIFSF